MNIKTIVNERKRGCGYRQPGGLYLIAGQSEAPCGKLPLELSVCPCCGQGIKPARGWTWVNGKKLFDGVECVPYHRSEPDACAFCILHEGNIPEKMGLLWIGEKFYATPEEFLKESMTQGISRRITAIPNEFEIGKTWVLFAHRKAIARFCAHPTIERRGNPLTEEQLKSCPDCNGDGYIYLPAIFGCFLPERIEYIVKDEDEEEKLERLEKRGITLIRLVRTDDGNGNGVLKFKEEEVMA